MKPNSHFKLPKRFKRIMATIVDKDLRDAYRSASIQAQLYSLIKPETKKQDKK